MTAAGRSSLSALIMAMSMAIVTGCVDTESISQANAVCEAVSEERFSEAIQLSASGSSNEGPGREITECRCIAMLSLGDRRGCTDLLGPLLAEPEASDWVPHVVLTKLMLRSWQAENQLADAANLARRAATTYTDDLDLLQLELHLRASQEDEASVLADLESRLRQDLESLPQRLVLSMAWSKRGRFENALLALGDLAPPITHPLALPWYESRIGAQAKAGDLAGVQKTFASWRETGWNPADLDARYALRLSTDQLRDPRRNTVDLLRDAIFQQAELRDPQIIWALHRRLITELLGMGKPHEALDAYDVARQTISVDGITREEIERAVQLAERGLTRDAKAQLQFAAPAQAIGGHWMISPSPRNAPDAGYKTIPIESTDPASLSVDLGPHPLRWILRDAEGNLGGSGSVWPENGLTKLIDPNWQDLSMAERAKPPTTKRRPADGRRRVFAILADCGDWRLTEYLRARGELPFHDRLFAEGHRAVLTSRPAFTAAAMQSLVWPSAGDGNDRRGGLGWIHHLGLELAGLESVGRNPVEVLSWLLPERPNLFETLGAGPIVTANMLLAHGRIDAGRHAELVGPHGTRRDLETQRAYRPLDADERARHPALSSDPSTRKHAETIAAEMDAAEVIASGGEVDFLFIRLEALDLITHAHFGEIDGTGQDDGRGALLSAYRYIDERLGQFDALLDADDWLVYLSDHGIRSSMQHEEDAIFAVLGDGVPAGRTAGTPDLRGIPQTLARMLQVQTNWPDTGVAPWLPEAVEAHAESDPAEQNSPAAAAATGAHAALHR